MNKDCSYYFPVEPLRSLYRDEEGTTPLLEIPVETPRGTVTVAILGQGGDIEAIRIRVPDCVDEKLTEWHLKMIQTLKEHALSVLRICVDADVQLASHAFWAFATPGAPSGIRLEVGRGINPHFVLNVSNIRNVYVNSFSAKEDLGLLSDGINPRTPIQFRYLSLYLLLERLFKSGNSWRGEFNQLIDSLESEWRKLAVSDRPLRKYIHAMRDRCAHVRGRGKLVGVTMLSNKDALELQTVLPLMIEIARTAVNQEHSDKRFSLVRRGEAKHT